MAPRCDVIIRDGVIFDGTGAPRFNADVAISGDRIVAVGDLGTMSADREVIGMARQSLPVSSTHTRMTTERFCAALLVCCAKCLKASRRSLSGIAAFRSRPFG